jgi:hypothetical protein
MGVAIATLFVFQLNNSHYNNMYVVCSFTTVEKRHPTLAVP